MRYGTLGFQPQKLLQLRTNLALTQTELAERLSCSKGNISKWEQGKSCPENESFRKICKFFNVSETWLLEPIMSAEDDNPSFFRAQNRTPKISRQIADIRLNWTEEVSYKLQESLDFPEINLPTYDNDFKSITDGEIENLALECRRLWGLSNSPINNLLISMESNGLVVTRGNLGFSKMDGVSRWSLLDNRPYVFLCKDKANGFRARFDAAHELGHVILHKGVTEPDYKKYYHLLEAQANRFASAILLPASSFVRDVRWPTLENLLVLKSKWKVSVAAIIHRCQDLGVISDTVAQRLWKARSARGWVHCEPNDDSMVIEEAKLLNRSVRMLVENKILNKDAIKNIIGLPVDTIEEICGLPKKYFSNEENVNIIDLRLRAKSTKNNPFSKTKGRGKIVNFTK